MGTGAALGARAAVRTAGLAAAAGGRTATDIRAAGGRGNCQAAFILGTGLQRPAERIGDTIGNRPGNFDEAFMHADADRADIPARHMSAAAQQG